MCWESRYQLITLHLHGSNWLVNSLIYGCNEKLHFESSNDNSTGTQVTAYTYSTSLTYPTICHSLCELLVAGESKRERCQQCIQHRNTLRKMVHREAQRKSDELACPSSHVNYHYLHGDEKNQQLHNMHSL